MRRRFTRLALGASLAVGSLGVLGMFGLPAAHATGPGGCAAQTSNGAVAAGTLTDSSPPTAPAPAPAPTGTCSATLSTSPTSYGGWAGGDSVSWSISGTGIAANDLSGQPCVTSGTGPVTGGGYGCLLPGASFTVTIG